MNVITISREFGSGGRELGKRLADYLEYDYYDSEIISAVAAESGMDAKYIERILDEGFLQNHTITFRNTIGSVGYLQSSQITLLLEQKKVIEKIASMGRNFVIVGRNADVVLRDFCPFNVFVCASAEAKLKRSKERAPEGENLTDKELIKKMKQIDKARAHTREIMADTKWGQRDAYHLIVNTTDWEIKELVPAVADFAVRRFERKK